MKERPIIFNGEMVRAILDGRKTQTRRPVTSRNSETGAWPWGALDWTSGGQIPYADGDAKNGGQYLHVRSRPKTMEDDGIVDRVYCRNQPGDRLYVRETFQYWDIGGGAGVYYRATEPNRAGPWSPSIHMPKELSRIMLEITGVRVERVQDISEEDAREEGLSHDPCGWFVPGVPATGAKTASEAFSQLWSSIYNAHGFGWTSNPWVWVIEFRRIGT